MVNFWLQFSVAGHPSSTYDEEFSYHACPTVIVQSFYLIYNKNFICLIYYRKNGVNMQFRENKARAFNLISIVLFKTKTITSKK